MKSWLLKVVLPLAVAFSLAAAHAQQAVQTYPIGGSTNGATASTTIASTNTFQQVFAAAPAGPAGTVSRHGCTIVNYGSNTMWVSEGVGLAASAKANSIQLAANQAYYCAVVNGVVLQGQINITGTSGDAFYAAQY